MSNETSYNRPVASILWFLIITFAITYVIELTLIREGIRFDDSSVQSTPTLWLLAVMWIPGLAALFVTKVVEGVSFRGLTNALLLRMGSVGPYFLTFFIAPMAFAAMYSLSWALGLTNPDLTMTSLTDALGYEESLTQETVFQVMLPLSIFLGPLINFVFGLGEEIGWRGFLLPRLMPLGKFKAYLILGILWGLWHAPLIYAGFNYPGHPITGIFMMCALSFAFGLFINEMTLHYRSSLLAAFIHGAVNAQGYGIWAWVFPRTDPIMGGGTGYTGIAVWLVVGTITILILSKLRPDES